MPPTVQTNEVDHEKRPPRTTERRSELVCRVKFCNTLPDIPFDLKFITYPFPPTRFIQYNPTSLEKSYRYEVLTEHDLGVHIDLINRDIYQNDGHSQLDPADEKLLEEDVLTPQDSKRSRHHAKNVSWLRRSEYISTEQTRFQPQSMEKVEAKVGYNVKKIFSEETLYMDRDSQIAAIEKTFEDNKITIDKHYSKPGVTPIEVLPVFPDFEMWKYPCAQVIFDTDPAPQDRNISGQIEQMSQAMIRGVMDESGEQFVAYFLPTEETLMSRRRDLAEGVPYLDGDTYEYKMAREYNWNVKSKASKGYEENYFLVVRNGQVFYNELETRVRLSKRRARAGAAGGATRLIVSHRPLSAREHRMLRLRERQLEPPQDDDEEEDDEEEAEDEEKREEETRETREERSRSRSKSRSVSKSPAGSKQGSQAGSNAGSRAPSEADSGRSRSASREGSAHSRSRSKSYSRSRSKSKSKSRSRSRSRSATGSRSGSSSPAGSRKSRSRSGSARSRSRSGSRSGSRASSKGSRGSSRASSRAASGSGGGSNAGSRVSSRASSHRNSGSGSGSDRSRSRSASGSRQGSRSGSASSGSSHNSASD